MHLGSLSGAAEGETGQGVQGVCAPGWGPLSPVAVPYPPCAPGGSSHDCASWHRELLVSGVKCLLWKWPVCCGCFLVTLHQLLPSSGQGLC